MEGGRWRKADGGRRRDIGEEYLERDHRPPPRRSELRGRWGTSERASAQCIPWCCLGGLRTWDAPREKDGQERRPRVMRHGHGHGHGHGHSASATSNLTLVMEPENGHRRAMGMGMHTEVDMDVEADMGG